jgi:hypothetical protein
LEKFTEKSLKSHVEKRGGLCLKLLSTFFVGLPDRLVLLPGGKIGFVEVKSEGKTPRARQTFVHDLLRNLGFKVFVLDRADQIEDILNEIAK